MSTPFCRLWSLCYYVINGKNPNSIVDFIVELEKTMGERVWVEQKKIRERSYNWRTNLKLHIPKWKEFDTVQSGFKRNKREK